MSLRRMMLFTLGAKITNQIQYFKARVLGNQGQFEGETCLDDQLTDLDNKGLLDSASLIVTPNGYKENLLFSVVPNEVGTNLFQRSEEFENGYWNKTRCTISTNKEIAPNGSLTADYVVEDSTTGLRYVGVIGVPTTIGQTWTFSIFVKKKDRSQIGIQINEGSAIFPTVKFNFDSQSFTQTTPLMTSSFQSVGDGWFRLIFTRTPTTGTTTVFGIHPTDASGNIGGVGDGVSRTIIWGAQLVPGSIVTNYISTTDRTIINGTIGDMSVTRATTGTRVNADGLIETVPYNLFSQSQNFENAFWTKQLTTIGQNIITAPDGTMTADNVIANSGVTYNYIGVNGVNVVSNSFPLNTEQRTLSLYLKYNGLNRIIVMYGSSTNLGGDVFVEVDLQSGIITNSNGGIVASNFFIEDAGNGWYRVGFNLITTLSTNNRFAVALGDTTKTIANGVDGVYVWGAQLVQGTQAKDYFPTTNRFNIPRIDYSNGSCPSILVEPQRTNLFTYSEEFQHSSWAWGSETFYPNTIISPDGNLTADRIVVNSNNATIANKTLTITPGIVGTTYTMSVWIKSNISSFTQEFEVLPVGTHDFILTYITTRSYTADTNWKRVTVTFTLSSASNMTATVYFRLARIFNGLGLDFSLWGAQLELGGNVTSYIPTTTTAVTRNEDQINNNLPLSVIPNDKGTIYCEVFKNTTSFNQASVLGTNSEFLLFSLVNNSFRVGFRLDGGSTSLKIGNSGGTTPKSNGVHKLLLTFGDEVINFYCDGEFITSRAYSGNFKFHEVVEGNRINLSRLYGSIATNPSLEIRSIIIYKTQLTNTQAIQLTTL